MAGRRVRFYQKSNCGHCRRAKAVLEHLGLDLEIRDLIREPLNRNELTDLIGSTDVREFLNPASSLFRQRRMSTSPPTKSEAIRLMMEDPNLIRRPIIVKGKRKVFGFEESVLKDLARP
jgi:Spx/MgsR family transcriptional regulator